MLTNSKYPNMNKIPNQFTTTILININIHTQNKKNETHGCHAWVHLPNYPIPKCQALIDGLAFIGCHM